jgi:hypothetical protein
MTKRRLRSLRRASIPLTVLFAGLISTCGQYDQRLCNTRRSIDYTFAVTDADYQSFVHDDGELDQTECAALCDCLSPVPRKSAPNADATAEVDADAGGRTPTRVERAARALTAAAADRDVLRNRWAVHILGIMHVPRQPPDTACSAAWQHRHFLRLKRSLSVRCRTSAQDVRIRRLLR